MLGRGASVLALALPVLAGITSLIALGAPRAYATGNALALGLAVAMILGLPNAPRRGNRLIALVLLAVLFLPLVTGPAPNGIARWVPLGPIVLHSGSLALPALAVLAARDVDYAPPILLAALLAALLQPDAATGLAITLAAVGLYKAGGDWRLVPVAGIAFFASLVAGLRGELPARPYVERLLVQHALTMPTAAIGLALALLGGFILMAHALPAERRVRHALAGALFGFSLAAVVSNYPSVLIGYGAGPILGFGLALAFARQTSSG